MPSIPFPQGKPQSYIPYSQLLSFFAFWHLDRQAGHLRWSGVEFLQHLPQSSFSVDSGHSLSLIGDHRPFYRLQLVGAINLPAIWLQGSIAVFHLNPMIHANSLRHASGHHTRMATTSPMTMTIRSVQKAYGKTVSISELCTLPALIAMSSTRFLRGALSSPASWAEQACWS